MKLLNLLRRRDRRRPENAALRDDLKAAEQRQARMVLDRAARITEENERRIGVVHAAMRSMTSR